MHLIESTDHAGGRTRNYDLGTHKFDTDTDSVVEVGGTFVAPGHTELIALANATGHPIYNVSGAVAGKGRRKPRLGAPPGEWPWWYWGVDTTSKMRASVFLTKKGRLLFKTPSDLRKLFSNATWAELEAAGVAVQAAADSIDCSHDTVKSSSAWFEHDSITFEGWIQQHLQHEESKAVLRNMNRGMIAQEASQVSFLSTLKSLKGCWSAGAEDQYRVRGGTQAIPMTLATRVAASKLGHVTYSSPVRQIDSSSSSGGGGSNLEDTGKALITVISDKVTIKCKYVVVTGPPPLVAAIAFTPPRALGHLQAQLLQRMPMGTSMKFFVTYATPWWRAAGFSGAVMASSWDQSWGGSGRINAGAGAGAGADATSAGWGDHFDQCMEHSPFDGTMAGHSSPHFALMCWIEGETNNHFYTLSDVQQREHVLSFLSTAFNDTRAHTLALEVVAHNWADQQYARGAYTGYFPPGVQSQPETWSAFAGLATAPAGGLAQNVWLAGSDYTVGFGNGYIEGAIRGGYTAADTVAAAAGRS